MANASISGGVHAAAVHSATVVLTPGELLAAKRALANLAALRPAAKVSALLTGNGTDTFAGGVAGSTRTLPGFRADTVVGGASATAKGVAASTQVRLAGPTAAGVKASDPAAQHAGSQVISVGNHSTVNLLGVSSHTLIKPH